MENLSSLKELMKWCVSQDALCWCYHSSSSFCVPGVHGSLAGQHEYGCFQFLCCLRSRTRGGVCRALPSVTSCLKASTGSPPPPPPPTSSVNETMDFKMWTTYTTIQLFRVSHFVLKEINSFIQQACIKLIKKINWIFNTLHLIFNILQKICFSCSFEHLSKKPAKLKSWKFSFFQFEENKM